MSVHHGGGFGHSLRKYSVALGFVLGQIAPLSTSLPREPAAIVRTEPDHRDRQGFDPRERVSGAQILTVPHRLLGGTDGRPPDLGATERREPDWLRRN